MTTITINTQKKEQVIDVTDKIEEKIREFSVDSGICAVHLLHTTAALTTADLDPGTDKDFLEFLRSVVPDITYRHPHDPSHAPDHLLASVIGTSISLPFENRKLVLGTWQHVVLVELDGPRKRNITISIIAAP